jgi:hypothetical protein
MKRRLALTTAAACVFTGSILLIPPMSLAQVDVEPSVPTINEAPAGTATPETTEPELPYPHPRLSSDARWAGVMAFVIVPALFLAAAMIGALVYSEMPEDRPPVAHAHDEPPGTSHHHGPGGTVQPGPEHELPGGHAEHH